METSVRRNNSSIVILAAIIIVIAGVMYASSIVNPLLMAFFISIILGQPIAWLKKKRVPDGLAITIVILSLLSIYVLLFELIGASLSMFLGDISNLEVKFSSFLESAQSFAAAHGISAGILSGGGLVDHSKLMQRLANLFDAFGDIMSKEITFIFLTIFLLSEIKGIALKMKVIAKNSNVSLHYLKSVGDSIRHYLSIKTATSFITGLLVAVGLRLIGVDYPILWGLVAFLLNYIPTIGSIIAAIPAIIFSLIDLGFPGSFYTIGLYVVINVVIGNVVEPKMMGKGLGLSTFIVFFGLIFWGFILGPVGMFLSVPLMVVIKVALEDNPKTAWIAALLGTESDVKVSLGLKEN